MPQQYWQAAADVMPIQVALEFRKYIMEFLVSVDFMPTIELIDPPKTGERMRERLPIYEALFEFWRSRG